VKMTSVPEVAFLGRSNVGKSSLLNALMAQKNLCYTSAHPGKTRTMNGFSVGGPDGMGNPGRLTVLDMPGYGKGSREEWGKEISKYLLGRKEYVNPGLGNPTIG
jgi:GTP-binding protein